MGLGDVARSLCEISLRLFSPSMYCNTDQGPKLSAAAG